MTTLLSNAEINADVALALAHALDGEGDPTTLADCVRDYCACTLLNPRAVHAGNPYVTLQEILDGIATGRTWPTDLGTPSQQTTVLWQRWDSIAHQSLHYVLGDCPDGEEDETDG